MQLAGTVVNDLKYSFGTTGEDFEVPHVVDPIFPTFDKVLVTPPGATPPQLGIPFVEDLEYRKQRLKYKLTGDANVDLESVYSFSVNTSNLDLLKWNLVNVPLVRPIDLGTFFGNASIQLGMFIVCVCGGGGGGGGELSYTPIHLSSKCSMMLRFYSGLRDSC